MDFIFTILLSLCMSTGPDRERKSLLQSTSHVHVLSRTLTDEGSPNEKP